MNYMKKLTSILLSILLTLSSISPTFALEVTEENNLNSDEIVTENIDNTESQKDSILEEEEKQENSSKEEQSSTKTKPKSTEVKQKVEEKSTEKEEKVEESSKESTSDSINNEIVNDETVNDLTGNYSEIDDVEAISLYNEAAENKEDAIDVLIDELSFPKKDAKEVAEDLFDIKGNRALTKGDNDEEDQLQMMMIICYIINHQVIVNLIFVYKLIMLFLVNIIMNQEILLLQFLKI